MAGMLRIPAALHNVPQEKAPRSHARAGFGAQNARVAVCADCKFYGLLHR